MMELEFAVTSNELMDLGSNYQQAILLQQEKMINQYVPPVMIFCVIVLPKKESNFICDQPLNITINSYEM